MLQLGRAGHPELIVPVGQALQRLDPETAAVHAADMAVALAEQGWPEAVGHAEATLRAHPEDIWVRIKLGDVHRELGDAARAEEVYRQAIAQVREHGKPFDVLGPTSGSATCWPPSLTAPPRRRPSSRRPPRSRPPTHGNATVAVTEGRPVRVDVTGCAATDAHQPPAGAPRQPQGGPQRAVSLRQWQEVQALPRRLTGRAHDHRATRRAHAERVILMPSSVAAG
jgi:hypothetical protein